MQNKWKKKHQGNKRKHSRINAHLYEVRFVEFQHPLTPLKAYNTVKFLSLQMPGTHDLL